MCGGSGERCTPQLIASPRGTGAHRFVWPYCPKSRPSGYGRLVDTSRRSLVVIQQATEAWTPTDSALASTKCPALDEPILKALMIPLAMIVIDEFLKGSSEMALPERHDLIEALVFDRPRKSFGIGVRIGRLKRSSSALRRISIVCSVGAAPGRRQASLLSRADSRRAGRPRRVRTSKPPVKGGRSGGDPVRVRTTW